MSLAWNTRLLLSPYVGGGPIEAVPVEFHFLSHRELYDSTIRSADRHHSSAGEWAVYGDHHWYTVAVITRPVYAIPQELCLSFDCFHKTEKIGSSVMAGPPIDEVAFEFGALLSVLVREPLLPVGTRRIDGKPIRFEDRYGAIRRSRHPGAVPAAGINSVELRAIIAGLPSAKEADANAILAASRLYHAGLSLSTYDISAAYFTLVSAIECVSGHHLEQKSFEFDGLEKFKSVAEVINKISSLVGDAALIAQLKCELLRAENFVWQKFRDFIEEFLPDEFWQPDELHPNGLGLPTIERSALRRFLREAYSARSAFAHTGAPFPLHVEIGVSDRIDVRAMLEALALVGSSTRFVPPFVWFERLTHLVLREYLVRVIAPGRAEDRAMHG